ncbi:MAG: low temperature requirement protein A, partial [Actinomycetota bacterium]
AAERFGLFTIIVLGEVVVGVVDGLSEASRGARTIATGVIGLTIGFGVWWNYFDFVGRRPPRPGPVTRGAWNLGHMPLWLSIAAGGAGMVSLVEHATDARTPAATSWLVTGSVAGVTLSVAVIVAALPPRPGLRMVPYSLAAAAGFALVLGALRPTPILLVLGLVAALSAVWFEAFTRKVRAGAPMGTG